MARCAAAELSLSMAWGALSAALPSGCPPEAPAQQEQPIGGSCSFSCKLKPRDAAWWGGGWLGGAIPDLLLPYTGSRGSNVLLAHFSRSLQHFQQWFRCPGMSSMAQELSPAKQRLAFLCHPPGGAGSSGDLSFISPHGLEIWASTFSPRESGWQQPPASRRKNKGL